MMNNIPELLKDRLYEQYGEKTALEIMNGYVPRPVTFRLNPLRGNSATLDKLREAGFHLVQAPFYNDGWIISSTEGRNSSVCEEIMKMPLFQSGEIYLQSLSSMLPPIILNPGKGEGILDMAAAPGGKTTEIAALSGDTALITACERDTIRCQRLQHNIQIQGLRKASVINQDSRQLSDFFSFDKILLDAPCTGSGTISSDEAKPRRMTEDWVDKINRTQRGLMAKAVKLVKKGGTVVYSTCSVLESENEAVVEYAESLGMEVIPIDEQLASCLPQLKTKIPGTLVVKPTSLYEGFFVAHMRKK